MISRSRGAICGVGPPRKAPTRSSRSALHATWWRGARLGPLLASAALLLTRCGETPASDADGREAMAAPPPLELTDNANKPISSDEPNPPATPAATVTATRSEPGAKRVSESGDVPAEPLPAGQVQIRRLVYRVAFVVPQPFRDRRAVLAPVAGELVLDVSDRWVEGRFSGPAWPVPEGAIALVYRDRPGAIVYDGTGKQELGPGRLASWFEGRSTGSSKTFLSVRREYGHNRTTSGPGELVCTFLAEWSAGERDDIMRRCSGNVLPPGFRLGPWRSELTAVVPLKAPEPEAAWKQRPRGFAVAGPRNRQLMDPAEIAAFLPGRRSRARSVQRPGAQLRFANNLNTSVMVIVNGATLGWVGAGGELLFQGFVPDRYRVGAVRPLGRLCHGPRLLTLPGEIALGKARGEQAAEGALE